MIDKRQQLQAAIERLSQNQVVAFPTETVYGLGARIDSAEGINQIFKTKKRPFFDPLIVHVSSIEQAKSCFHQWNSVADTLARHFWPGPLTLVMEKSGLISDVITSGLPRVGVRVPRHTVALELLNGVGVPLAAPSANRFGKTSPTTADHVRNEFGGEVLILESDIQCEVGIESTVLLIKNENQLSLLRKGAVVKSEIENVLKKNNQKFSWLESVDNKESPGHLKHHYMPDIPFIISKNLKITVKELSQRVLVELDKMPEEIEGVKIIKPTTAFSKIEFFKLPETPQQAAREVYSLLRKASERKPDLLCFIMAKDYSKDPEHELWESVFDRLYKAASLIID